MVSAGQWPEQQHWDPGLGSQFGFSKLGSQEHGPSLSAPSPQREGMANKPPGLEVVREECGVVRKVCRGDEISEGRFDTCFGLGTWEIPPEGTHLHSHSQSYHVVLHTHTTVTRT